ncbi:MAG: GvpL/GvpF family gas vesicle protein [Chloroherpetonaceae bacterium]|nr:GvpL/GvpF family gas vesicle protein [Chloroherpetonaceae bacterium]MDW8437326.1 GvpL/GvpF family gas vesicle protein [Chloroherpetonaceae bacterium]
MQTYSGRYIYAIVETWRGVDRPKSLGNSGIGGRGDEIYLVEWRDIGAFVSASPLAPYPVSRENALAHERAVEAAMKHYALLPMRFSMIAQSERDVMALLEKHYDLFKAQLARLEGKKELGLKGMFPETIFQDLLRKNEAIQRRKEELARRGNPTQSELIEIGKMVEAALNAEKEKWREEILAQLRPLAEETKVNPTTTDRMFLNAAFLASEAQEAEIDKKVSEIAERYEGKFKLKYVGNLPPYNFLRLTITLNDATESE